LDDLVARHGVQGGRPERLPGPQIEARMMPGTAHGVVDHQTFGEGATIVRAGSPDGEDVGTPANEDHGIGFDEAE
jgi:hypothetical protein